MFSKKTVPVRINCQQASNIGTVWYTFTKDQIPSIKVHKLIKSLHIKFSCAEPESAVRVFNITHTAICGIQCMFFSEITNFGGGHRNAEYGSETVTKSRGLICYIKR